MKFKPTLSRAVAGQRWRCPAWRKKRPRRRPPRPRQPRPAPLPRRPRPPADPTALKPFAEISKDFKQDDGLFPIWRKDDKVLHGDPARAG